MKQKKIIQLRNKDGEKFRIPEKAFENETKENQSVTKRGPKS